MFGPNALYAFVPELGQDPSSRMPQAPKGLADLSRARKGPEPELHQPQSPGGAKELRPKHTCLLSPLRGSIVGGPGSGG